MTTPWDVIRRIEGGLGATLVDRQRLRLQEPRERLDAGQDCDTGPSAGMSARTGTASTSGRDPPADAGAGRHA